MLIKEARADTVQIDRLLPSKWSTSGNQQQSLTAQLQKECLFKIKFGQIEPPMNGANTVQAVPRVIQT
eukprot:scaffold464398_cov22-Prasinocladus_malaysianus.AAC.1